MGIMCHRFTEGMEKYLALCPAHATIKSCYFCIAHVYAILIKLVFVEFFPTLYSELNHSLGYASESYLYIF